MKIDLHFSIDLTKKQQEVYDLFHQTEVSEIVMNFSRQSGKTTLAEILLIETMVKKKCNCAYISPSYAQGRKVFREIMALLQQTTLVAKKNSAELTIELLNGSHLQFFTAQSPTAIRGNTISGLLVLDECAYLPEETPDGQLLYPMVIQPITKAKHPKILFISTPNGKNGLFYDKYLEGLSSETTRTVECNIYTDSTIASEDIEELKKITPPMAWRQEYLCEFLDSSITVFEGFEKQFVSFDKVKIIDKKVWIGVDFSTVGEDDTIVTKLSSDGYVEQFVITGSLDAKYQRIASIINSENNLVMVYLESNSIGEPMINEIRKLTRKKNKLSGFQTTNATKKDMVALLQTAIANNVIFFNEEDKELYQQLGVFTYTVNKKTRNITFAAKPPYHDDRVMSLCLALQAREDKKALFKVNNYFTPDYITKIR